MVVEVVVVVEHPAECRCNRLLGRELVCSRTPALGNIPGCCSYSGQGREYFYSGDREYFYSEDRE